MLKRSLPVVLGLALLASAAEAETVLGYSYLKYLEEGGGSAPVGAFLSMSGSGRTTLELDLAWHRDSEGSTTLNTFTATIGPQFRSSGLGPSPFLHVLAGVRHDRIEGSSNSSFGGMAGAGVVLGDSFRLRLGADFQVFFDEGENVKTLRLGVGIVF